MIDRLDDVIVSAYGSHVLALLAHERADANVHTVPIAGWSGVATALADAAS